MTFAAAHEGKELFEQERTIDF